MSRTTDENSISIDVEFKAKMVKQLHVKQIVTDVGLKIICHYL